MKAWPARPPLLNIPTARHFENWLSINMVANCHGWGGGGLSFAQWRIWSSCCPACTVSYNQATNTWQVPPQCEGKAVGASGCALNRITLPKKTPKTTHHKAAKTRARREKRWSSSALAVTKLGIKHIKSRRHLLSFVFLLMLRWES